MYEGKTQAFRPDSLSVAESNLFPDRVLSRFRSLHNGIMSSSSKFTIKLKKDEDSGWYTAQCVELPEAISQGETMRGAVNNVKEAIILVLEDRKESARKEGDRLIVVTV